MRSRRSLTCAAVVFGLLACSDRSITRSVLAHEPASGGRPNASTSQVPAADIASAIRAALVDGRSLRSPFTPRSQGQLIDFRTLLEGSRPSGSTMAGGRAETPVTPLLSSRRRPLRASIPKTTAPRL